MFSKLRTAFKIAAALVLESVLPDANATEREDREEYGPSGPNPHDDGSEEDVYDCGGDMAEDPEADPEEAHERDGDGDAEEDFEGDPEQRRLSDWISADEGEGTGEDTDVYGEGYADERSHRYGAHYWYSDTDGYHAEPASSDPDIDTDADYEAARDDAPSDPDSGEDASQTDLSGWLSVDGNGDADGYGDSFSYGGGDASYGDYHGNKFS